ncbi:GHMP kinase [Candidatus Omnitrophota bacterium]
MIISRTPLRVSFAGGGSDLKEYYRDEFGAVTSMAIDKYVYITINKRFDRTIRIAYSQLEIVDRADRIKHNLVREAMKLVGVKNGVEITSVADIPSKGTGLGSSSSFTVGLLNALYAFKGKMVSVKELAEQACHIEIDILKDPIGKQDQYIAAFGGVRHFRFCPDGKVRVDAVACGRKTKEVLTKNLLLFYTGITRSTHSVLARQKKRTKKGLNRESLTRMKTLAVFLKEDMKKGLSAEVFGGYLHNNWTEKRQLSRSVSNRAIDGYYRKALRAGATGGKLLGAGGGGFLLFSCPARRQDNLRKALKGLVELPFRPDSEGSRIIFGGNI